MASELPDILERIVRRRRERLGASGPFEIGREPAAPLARGASRFLEAVTGRRGRALIAEIKMGSPRLGPLAGRIDPRRQAETYARTGAVALSVVVEPDFFFGSYELLGECRRASGLPALAKDFLVHPCQIDWAVEAGADAVLLIAALYDARELAGWADRARAVGLVPLVETHGEDDVEKLEGREWELVGINNRDLRTFEVDIERSIALHPRLPEGALTVAESGIGSGEDLGRLREAGFDAFLVGESLLLADDVEAKIGELLA